MNPHTVILERGPAQLSAAEMRDLFDSRAFQHFLARVDSLIESERKVLETAAGDDVAKAQGAVRAYRKVKEMPVEVVKDLAAKEK